LNATKLVKKKEEKMYEFRICDIIIQIRKLIILLLYVTFNILNLD